MGLGKEPKREEKWGIQQKLKTQKRETGFVEDLPRGSGLSERKIWIQVGPKAVESVVLHMSVRG